MTTVGYGDISPRTAVWARYAAVVMVLGFGMIAVPTGIVTVEMARSVIREVTTQRVPRVRRRGPRCGGQALQILRGQAVTLPFMRTLKMNLLAVNGSVIRFSPFVFGWQNQ